ncbi:hypothetical protein CXP39_02075 [Mesoplasma syrphidae]|uniref:Uncharacterized protein n=1 Tax=Mesoplasma syrphidae TaxID=225999 RepID=A0A2K9C274_9MOLU|nr:hypothetical protein [Mesoplasma syrphidae]AUF83579.1 hypothetical protein CXP39_02075 [Mesoplasma syrphidae]
MTYNILEKIDLEEIALKIFQSEIKILDELILKTNDSALDKVYQQLKNLYEVTSIEAIISNLAVIFNDLSSLKIYDLAIIFQQFIQRYLYFGETINNFKSYWEENKLNFNDIQICNVFWETFAPFFNGQINFYTQRYLNLINTSDTLTCSSELSSILNQFCNSIIQNQDITQKIHYTEEFCNYLSDFKNIIMKINIDQVTEAKEQFLNNTMEMKVATQSITIFIEKVVEKINNEQGE